LPETLKITNSSYISECHFTTGRGADRGDAMKTVLALFLAFFPLVAFAQNQGTAAAAGCGPRGIKFDVKKDKHNHSLGQPSEGKALVYFLEDDSMFASILKPTTRVGVDGTWAGATHGDSYFYFSVDPGEHHLCASWQYAGNWSVAHDTAAVHFTARTGDVFYFLVRNIYSKEWLASIDLEPVDRDEAVLLMSTFSFSSSRPKPD